MADASTQEQPATMTQGDLLSSQSSNPSPSGQPVVAPAAAAPSPSPTPATKVERPAYVPETFWDNAAGKVKDAEFGQHLNELTAFKAAEDSKRLTLPQKPDDYKLDLPPDFQVPQGMSAPTFDEKNQLTGQARAWAAKHGLTQAALSEGLALVAGDRLSQDQFQKQAFEGEVAKLGATGPARIDALKTWMNAVGVAPLTNTLWTAEIVQTFEKLMQKVTTQGGGAFSQAHRDQGGAVPSDEAYAKMSFAEKMDYARTHSNGVGKTT